MSKRIDPTKELPILDDTLSSIVRIGASHVSPELNTATEDHYALMTHAFALRQLDLARAMLSLYSARHSDPLVILSRVMAEGMMMLAWCSQNTAIRPLKWRAWAFVRDYRLAMQNQEHGSPMSHNEIETIRLGLEEYGYHFLRSGYELKIDFVSDPFRLHWLSDDDLKRITNKDYFASVVNGSDVYLIYSDMSNWVHWNVSSIESYLSSPHGELCNASTFNNTSGYAMTTAILSSMHTLHTFDQHCEIGMGATLDQVKASYVDRIRTARGGTI